MLHSQLGTGAVHAFLHEEDLMGCNRAGRKVPGQHLAWPDSSCSKRGPSNILSQHMGKLMEGGCTMVKDMAGKSSSENRFRFSNSAAQIFPSLPVHK